MVHWRAGCDESRKSGSEGGCWRPALRSIVPVASRHEDPQGAGCPPYFDGNFGSLTAEINMRYRIQGRDEASQSPIEPFFVDAVDEKEARSRAAELGTLVDSIELASPETPSPRAAADREPGVAKVDEYT